jgi:hypothetical protein
MKGAGKGLVERVLRVDEAAEGEQHVIGVEAHASA